MLFSELPEWAKNDVLEELWINYAMTPEESELYVENKDDFEIVDYSSDEDGSDLRVEY